MPVNSPFEAPRRASSRPDSSPASAREERAKITLPDPTIWEVEQPPSLEARHIETLLRNDIGAMVLPNFLSPSECHAVALALETAPWEVYADREPPVGKVGITQTEHADGREQQRRYFERVAAHEAIMREIFTTAGIDLLARVHALLADAWTRPVRVARDPTHGRYAVGVFRRIGVARLHRDFAAVDAKGWSIASMVGQLAWNVYLAVGEGVGGETVVYRRPWTNHLERFRVADCYSYSAAAVAGAPSITIRPKLGDFVLFSSRNFHEVLTTRSARITYSSFAGVTAEPRELVLFS